MQILLYQVAIFSIIVLAGIVFKKKGVFISIILMLIWTIVLIHTSSLMILQLFTIYFAAKIAYSKFNTNSKIGDTIKNLVEGIFHDIKKFYWIFGILFISSVFIGIGAELIGTIIFSLILLILFIVIFYTFKRERR